MTVSEMTTVFLKIRDSIYFYVNFFLVGVIALIGWRISLKDELDLTQRIVTTVLFFVFWYICFASLNLQYKLLEASRKDIFDIAKKEIDQLDFYKALEDNSYEKTRIYVLFGLGIMLILTISVIWGFANN